MDHLGIVAGLRPESPISKTIMAGSILGFSLPTFWVGLMMITLFAVILGWLPATAWFFCGACEVPAR